MRFIPTRSALVGRSIRCGQEELEERRGIIDRIPPRPTRCTPKRIHHLTLIECGNVVFSRNQGSHRTIETNSRSILRFVNSDQREEIEE